MAVTAWMYRDELADWWSGFTGDAVVATEPSPELAALAEAKIEALAGVSLGGDPPPGSDEETVELDPDEPVRFSEAELQSLVQYRLASRFPEGVYNPTVDVRDSTVALSVDLDLARLSTGDGAVENLRRLIGDSTRVIAELRPAVVSPGTGQLEVLRLQAGAVPVPAMFIPNILQQAGFEADGRRIRFAVPRDVREVRIEPDAVVLLRQPGGG